ncbi:NADH-quinone oxidoreductase subunit NuoN [Actinomyces sp. zg-332]|uniref:NADH-quinone oxidoreductase subunit NuoN n=1 Tax=Actinomyces sp. zg-332 TaxID=2708340 RepID=UPI00142055EE|nr:NADH-quinone oxidoreductase subunit NuoN [Actinomyces sp. zg-332]QPK94011.1 NADH-quinone oxidoreductase subunit NuoN [Actinomyces sp. zg-332]
MLPEIHWILIAPILAVFMAGILGVIVETFVPARYRYYVHIIFGNVALLTALGISIYNLKNETPKLLVAGELVYDRWSGVIQIVLIVVTILSFQVLGYRNSLKKSYVFASNPFISDKSLSIANLKNSNENTVDKLASTVNSDNEVDKKDFYGTERTEYFPILMFSFGGMLVFVMAQSLLTLFVALELMSLPLYVLVAINKYHNRYSKEGAVKYFLMGSFASAFMLMGIALLYGTTGTFTFNTLGEIAPEMQNMVWAYVLGVLFVLVGFLFKIGAVPFHAWTPDAYQGAPTSVTGFMAGTVKIAGFAVLTRFIYSINPDMHSDLMWIYLTIVVLTILVGTFVGLTQSNVKRLLAYSSIAHTGFILIAVVAMQKLSNSGIIFYLFTYAIATVGAFTIISMVKRRDVNTGYEVEDNSLSSYAGLGKTNPFLAVSFLIFLLSYAGIPLTAGFIGKFMVFAAGIKAGMLPVVVLAIIASVITAFYYLRLVSIMFTAKKEQLDTSKEVFVDSGINTNTIVVAISLIITIVCGLFPTAFFGLLS